LILPEPPKGMNTPIVYMVLTKAGFSSESRVFNRQRSQFLNIYEASKS